uniref:Serpin-Z3-like n=1 Tax=Nicotiana tabacum TaxID=4097 RepID=A0A1S3ZK77_TOBAC|nr:PREDICTED: serpin-Z3-like [Nicotiana tabacum]
MAQGKEEKIDSCAQVAGRILLKEVIKKSDKSEYINILLSPLSFHAVLSMTAAGATGDTLNQMLQFLGVRNIDDLNSNFLKMAAVFESNSERDSNCPDLSFVSGIWVSYTHELKDSFKELVNTLYKTEAKSVDFQRKEEVVKEANLWASVVKRPHRRSSQDRVPQPIYNDPFCKCLVF